MRIGSNPNRNKIERDTDFFHQVILPVYVPSEGEYFADGLEILQYCVESLLLTVHAKTFITIVDNGSNTATRAYLQGLLSGGKIHELIKTTNIGKLNAVFKGISGHGFDFVTVVDSDVLFLNGWQEATYDVFTHFPKAGAVCPTPSPKSYKTYGSAILAEHLFSSKMKFTPVKNREGLLAFAHSVDNPDFYNEYQLEQILTISDGDFRAVIGAGHFFVTYKGCIFNKPVARYTNNKLGGERDLLDMPVVKLGLWRLSTEDNYAFHMGNVSEPWMAERIGHLIQNTASPEAPSAEIAPTSPAFNSFKYWLAGLFFKRKSFVRWFIRKKRTFT